MNIRLVKLSPAYKEQLTDMLKEWTDYNNHHDTNHSPWVIFKNDYHDFDNYLKNLEFTEDNLPEGFVPSSVFFCLDEDLNQFVGALEIRHYLNEKLLKDGGHIGDGIRPS
ncbi:MAG: GNAT family acetyltransferase, partial [Erysipelotrichaceae bacterium]|nr:GNAT family acetyltransferase [Erysipelotrichaceae bacterium]